jgi:hypothetical protein
LNKHPPDLPKVLEEFLTDFRLVEIIETNNQTYIYASSETKKEKTKKEKNGNRDNQISSG